MKTRIQETVGRRQNKGKGGNIGMMEEARRYTAHGTGCKANTEKWEKTARKMERLNIGKIGKQDTGCWKNMKTNHENTK